MTRQRTARTLSDIGIGSFLGGVAVSASAPLVGETVVAMASTSGLAALLVSQGIARWLAPEEFHNRAEEPSVRPAPRGGQLQGVNVSLKR